MSVSKDWVRAESMDSRGGLFCQSRNMLRDTKRSLKKNDEVINLLYSDEIEI
jgi:hypothetical protein